MKTTFSLLGATVAVLAIAGGAVGAGADGPNGPWADAVSRFVQGPRIDGSKVSAPRADATSALGPAEAQPGNDDPIPEGKFVSLGFGGSFTLAFQNPICNGPGADFAIEVREITKRPYPTESADVYVSADGVAFTKVGRISDDADVAVPHEIPVIWFVAFVDVTNAERFTMESDADGFDIDAVRAVDSSSCTGTAPALPAGGGDPLGGVPPAAGPVKCTPAYWKNPRVLKSWLIGPKRGFNAVFGVSTFPRKSMLAVVYQPGGGGNALGREAVLSLLTALTPNSHYGYSPAKVRALVKAAFASKKPRLLRARLIAATVGKLSKARAKGFCSLVA